MKALHKSTFREIKSSLGRYMAILAIVALGVGFFAGLGVSRDVMVAMGDAYLSEQRLFDFQLISTLGFTPDDVDFIGNAQHVREAEGSVSTDVLCISDDGADLVLKAHTLNEFINLPKLTAGRMPQSANEILVDCRWFSEDRLGSQIKISPSNDQDKLDMFAHENYTVVGLIDSPLYLKYDRGTTSLGNGSVSAFMFLMPGGFYVDYFTEIYLLTDAQGSIYSDEYEEAIDAITDSITQLGETRADVRYTTIVNEAKAELKDGRAKLEDARQEYLTERAKAEKELRDARAELEEGETTLLENEQKLKDGQRELADGRKQYNLGKQELEDSRKLFNAQKKAAIKKLNDAEKQLKDQLDGAKDGKQKIEDSGVLEQHAQLVDAIPRLQGGIDILESKRQEFLEAGDQLQASLEQVRAGIGQVEQAKAAAGKPLNEQVSDLDKAIEEAERELGSLTPSDAPQIKELEEAISAWHNELSEIEGQLAARQGEKADLEAKKSSVESEISLYRQEIADVQAEINSLDPQNDAEKIAELHQLITDWEGKIAQCQARLDSISANISEKESQMEKLKAQSAALTQTINDAQEELSGLSAEGDDERIAQLKALIAEKTEQKKQLQGQLANINQTFDEQLRPLQAQEASLKEQLDQYTASKEQTLQTIDSQLSDLNGQLTQARDGLRQIEDSQVLAQYAQLQDALPKLEAGLEQLGKQRESAKAQFGAAERKIKSGEISLAEAKAQLEDAQAELSDGLKQLEEGKTELEEGLTAYQEGVEEANAEFAKADAELGDAEAELEDGQQKIDEIEAPTVYTLDRSTNAGYIFFQNDSQIVQGIAKVFPLFFFMVAALVCMTTMTRMVEEQRTQIGVLKAIGYSRYAIMGKYMVYSGSAALIGCLIGFFGGSYMFPAVIWQAYHIMYSFADSITYLMDWRLGIISLGASLLCSVGATWASVRREMAVVPAQLIRPQTPKAGKRTILERISFVWNRLKFMHKVTLRNIMRYKKRMFMMVVGIGGCTALLITGLGVGDSVTNIVNHQFNEITTYDIKATFTDPLDASAQETLLSQWGDSVEGALFLHEGSVDVSSTSSTKSATIISSDQSDISNFIDMHRGQNPIATPQAGEAVISQGLAADLNLSPGKELLLYDSDMRQMKLTVSGVFDNYIGDYVYVGNQTARNGWGYKPEVNSAYINIPPEADPHAAATIISGDESVANIIVNSEMRGVFTDMISSMNTIVLVIVACAGALAFIVLYNLTNINITERVREIATLKVLGFYPKEVSAYVFSENIVLTFLGILAGAPLGIWLHSFVISQIKVNMVHFSARIAPMSYVWAVVLTFVFTFFVNFFMRSKLKKVNMAESLKTVE